MQINLQVKPLSVNRAYKGRRFRTNEYDKYERALLVQLPNIEIKPFPQSVHFEFGFSNSCQDIDGPVKLVLDILQKKYGFNDRDIYELTIRKILTKKGQEYIRITI